MGEEYKIIKKTFHHDVVEGSHYEIGKQQGEMIRKKRPEAVKWFISENNDPKKLGFKDFEELQASFEEVCPGITEEIAGFAEGLDIPEEKMSLYGAPIYEPGNCSQIAISPKITVDNHTYVGRNYEFYHEKDDLRLITTRIKGKPKTIGFSSFLLGRSDGLNECGFCITFTGGGTFKTKPIKKGYTFFLLTRSLLDNCKTVAEAVTHLKKIPVHGFWNFLMTDKNRNTALAQFFDGEYAIKEINEESKAKILFSGNHYWLPEMVKYQEYAGDWILKNSKKRHELINKTFAQAKGKISKETIRALLSKEIYEGLAGHYYTDYFGTLYSVIFDLTTLTVDICFGVPTHNDWQQPFTLDDPKGTTEYQAIFPDKPIKLDELFTNKKE